MQGVIPSTGREWSLILRDDSTMYPFAPEEWRGTTLEPSGTITFRMGLDR